MSVLCVITKHLFPVLMQPSFVLLPATSYPKTVGRMCYAISKAHLNRVKKHPLITNQSGIGRQNSMGCRHSIYVPRV